MEKARGKFFGCLPILAFFGYWLYSCPVCALLTREPRMFKLGVVNLPLLAVMAAAALKAVRSDNGRE